MRTTILVIFILLSAGMSLADAVGDQGAGRCSSSEHDDLWEQVMSLMDTAQPQPARTEACTAAGLTQEAKQGCCSHHGGVCGCNNSTGHQLCCDGADSPSCGC